MPHSLSSSHAFRLVAMLFGVVLIVASVLKLTTTGLDAPSPAIAVVPQWAVGLVPLFEMGLGLWLVSGAYRFGAWLVALPATVLFALHSLAFALEDRPSCGCFGSVTVPPVLTFLFDVLMAGLLFRCRPGWHGWPTDTPALRTAAMAVALLSGASGWAYARHGSIGVAVAAIRGESLTVTPDRLDLGRVDAGARVERTLRVHNLSDESVQVALSASKCSCVEVAGLPATVPPNESVELSIAVTVSKIAGRFRRKARLRTSAGVCGGFTPWPLRSWRSPPGWSSTDGGDGPLLLNRGRVVERGPIRHTVATRPDLAVTDRESDRRFTSLASTLEQRPTPRRLPAAG